MEYWSIGVLKNGFVHYSIAPTLQYSYKFAASGMEKGVTFFWFIGPFIF
jgi:hypothetical protein